MSSEETVLICALVADLATPTAGSVMRKCSECETPIWVSTDSVSKVIVAHGVAPILICWNCAQEAIAREGLGSIIAETRRVGI